MHSTATIVLPVHNRERTRVRVLRILDLAEVLHRRVVIAIVDDGSRTARSRPPASWPASSPRSACCGSPTRAAWADALEQVRTRLGVEQVVAHDGVTAIDLDELAHLLSTEQAPIGDMPAPREPNATQAARAVAPRRWQCPHARRPPCLPGSFRWLRLDEPVNRAAVAPCIRL